MTDRSDVRRGRTCVFALHVHLVFVTKYRRRVFTDEHLTAMQSILADVCTDFGARLAEFNGEDDHVHLLAYFAASCGGAPLSIIRQYIEQQRRSE